MITDVLMVMLNPQKIIKESASQAINYVQAIQDWTTRKGLGLPLYHYEEGSYDATLYYSFDGISVRWEGDADYAVYFDKNGEEYFLTLCTKDKFEDFVYIDCKQLNK